TWDRFGQAGQVAGGRGWEYGIAKDNHRETAMNRTMVLFIGAAVMALTSPALAADKAAYKAPRNVFGQADLGQSWTNATLTPEQRAATFVNRLVLTPQETAQLEGAA